MTTIEYALIASFISVAVIGSVVSLKRQDVPQAKVQQKPATVTIADTKNSPTIVHLTDGEMVFHCPSGQRVEPDLIQPEYGHCVPSAP